MKKNEKHTVLTYKILYTCIILFGYLVGRGLPLYGIDTAEYLGRTLDAQTILMQTVSGDKYRYSVLALGISPYMIASILVQVFLALRNSESKSKISPKKMNRISLGITLVLAVIQAVVHVGELKFAVVGETLILAKIVATVEMVTGAFIILWLAERNKKYGIGGQTALILVNILDGLLSTIYGHSVKSLVVPLVISFVVMMVMLVMENTELRIPVQRISIHNIYADKNYMAFKLNPIGIMPVILSSAFFMLPQLAVTVLHWLLPENASIRYCMENFNLSRPLGIGIYIAMIYLLTIGFSIVFLSPRDLTEQFLKSGDSILNLHAGKDTKRYLTKKLIQLGFLSATVMGICLGVPLILQMSGRLDSTLVMLPSSVMILTGIWGNLYQEIEAVKNYDAYQPFI